MSYPTQDSEFGAIRRLRIFEKIVYPVAVLVFLVMGYFWPQPSWIVLVVAWAVKKGLKFSRTGTTKLSMYLIDDITIAAFLITGLVFGRWGLASAFVLVSWIIEEAIFPIIRKKSTV